MKFTNRMGIKVLVVVAGVGAAGIVADWHLAASPSPVNSTKADSPPRVDVVHPRRATVAERLQTNATLEAFEEADPGPLPPRLDLPWRCPRWRAPDRVSGR